MSSIYLVLFSFVFFYFGYKYYSTFVGEKIFRINNNEITPANRYKDGIDFVPTSRKILFGHHFTSIAGVAPIIGPCIAVFWGWLPALLWVVFGTIFMGAVHDFGALVLSLKEKGSSVANITSKVINERTRTMFLIFVICLNWLVLAVFAMAIANLFILYPSSVLPVNIEIIIATIIGYLIYKKHINAFIPSVIALGVLYFSIYLGTIFPISIDLFGLENTQSNWIILLFIYSSIASLLPVWFLLQPRDYINSHQLIVGLILIYGSILIFRPEVTAPALNITENSPPIIPFLFVTIACGAISGFHGLVSSGTTSKQVNSMNDARFIGYGSMIGEASLSIATIIASVAGIALVTHCEVNGVFHEHLAWSDYYNSWENAAKNKFLAFVLGGGVLIEKLGLPAELSKTLISVLIISFAATTLDTATRIQRMIISELGKTIKSSTLNNKYIATLVGIIPAYYLTLNGTGWKLWPIFGASNQMLAALTLMILALYFYKKGKNILPLIIPMIFIVIITIIALFLKMSEFIQSKNYLLLSVSVILISLITWMLIEGLIQIRKRFIVNNN